MCRVTKEYLTDCSTQDEFSFSLCCEECGQTWRSSPIRFSKSGAIPATSGKRIVFETLYRQERETALSRAVKEATGVLNRCPICNRLVCDHCFMICDDLDMCCACAESLQEKGELVITDR